MGEPNSEVIVSEPQMDFLQERGREIATELAKGNFNAATYLDRSARPLLQFVRQGVRELNGSVDIKNYFLAVGADQVRGYFQYAYDMMNSTDPAVRQEYSDRFRNLSMYMDNMFDLEGISDNPFPNTSNPILRKEHLDPETIHEFFNESDLEKIKHSIRKRVEELNVHTLRVAVIDDLRGSGVSIQFACALLELLAHEVGVSLETEAITFLGYYDQDKTSPLFRAPEESKPYMPWKEDEELGKPAASFVHEQPGGSHLFVESLHKIAKEGKSRRKRRAAKGSMKQAKRLYQEIWTRLRT